MNEQERPSPEEIEDVEFIEDDLTHTESKWNRRLHSARHTAGVIGREAFAFSVLGLAAYGFVEVTDAKQRIEGLFDTDDFRYTPPDTGNRIDNLVRGYEGGLGTELTSDNVQARLKNDYESARHSLSGLGDYFNRRKNTDEEKEFLEQQRHTLIVDGLTMLKGYFGKGDIKFDQATGEVNIEGADLLLQNIFDEILIDQYITRVMKSETTNNLSEKERLHEDISDIVWLMHNQPDIEIEDPTKIVIDNDSLIILSRLSQELAANNHPSFPKLQLVNKLNNVAGVYIRTFTEENILSIDHGETLAHEVGHAQGYGNSDFGHDEYKQRIESIIELINREGYSAESEQAYVSPYARTSLHEDYAETFASYFTSGSEFRTILKHARETDMLAYRVLVEKYNFMKDLFGGKEFLEDGEEFMPEAGDEFIISDPDPNPGPQPITLRESPDNSSETTGFVYDGGYVKVIEGPVESHSFFFQKNLDHYKVQFVAEDGGTTEGWIAGIWFGGLINDYPVENK